MLVARGIISSLALSVVLGACVSDSQYNRAITDLDAQWKAENVKILEEFGHRTYQTTKHDAFAAALRAGRRLNMLIEEQDRPSGFVFASASAPTPLTKDEWANVQEIETPKMREILGESLGLLSVFANLDYSGKDVLVNVFLTERDEGVEVSVAVKLRNNKAKSDLIRRMEPPPTAVRLGLRKFFSAFEEELGE